MTFHPQFQISHSLLTVLGSMYNAAQFRTEDRVFFLWIWEPECNIQYQLFLFFASELSPHCHFWANILMAYGTEKKFKQEVQNWRNRQLHFPINFPEGLQLGQNEFIIEKLLGKLLFSLLCEFSAPLHRTRIRKKPPPLHKPTQPL